MSRIPFSGLDGQTQPGTIQAPDDYQRVQADPNAFGLGVAQAGQQLGGDVQKIGGELSNVALTAQQFQDRVANTESLNTLQDGMRAAQFGDPNNPQDVGYYGTKGKDALNAYPDAVQRVNDLRDSISSNMQDPRQQQMFDQQSRRLINSTLDTMARHRQQQLTQYGVDTQKAAVGSSLADAGMFYNDDDAFKNHLTDAVTSQRQADAAAGTSPEASDLNVRDVISTGWANRIKRLAADDPIAANNMLKANLGQLLPGQQTQLIDGLKAQVRSKEAASFGDNIPGGPASATPAPGAIPAERRDDILSQATAGTIVPKAVLNGLITQESGWDPTKQRQGGSDFGLGQILASTGADPGYGLAPISRADAADPVKNARFTAQYLEARGKAAGLTTPADWQDRAKVARALGAYNGGGDPNYAQNVLRNVPGSFQEAKAGTTMNDASGPPAAPQTQADYYRDNYDTLIQQARDQATAMHPEDPTFADLAASRRQQAMNQAIGIQKKSYEADSNTLWQAANGDLNKGTAPGTIDQLVASSPAAAAAWQRVQTQQPQLAHSIATRVLSQAGSPDKDKDAATYGPAFYNTFQQIHAPDGSASKITDPDHLYSLLGNGLTMAGVAKAREEIMSRRTPEGEADAQMRTQFFKNAHSLISGKDPELNIPDPKGEQNYLRFMGAALPAIQAAKAKGLTSAQIYNPDSPDYVGKLVDGFKRSGAQRLADMMEASKANAPIPPPDAPSFFQRMFGHTDETTPDLTTAEGIKSALIAGKLPRDEAIRRLRGVNAPAAPALPPAATETLPSGPQVPTGD